jgi:mono/diheme cytochrome c family protein
VIATVLALAAAALAAGCSTSKPGEKVVSPTPGTVIGKLPEKPSARPTGNAAAGKTLFVQTGCGACHTYKPAGSSGKVGPDLDKLPAEAKQANQGPLPDFVHTSIVSPDTYIAPGYPKGVMPSTYGTQLSAQQLADLVAFLTNGS